MRFGETCLCDGDMHYRCNAPVFRRSRSKFRLSANEYLKPLNAWHSILLWLLWYNCNFLFNGCWYTRLELGVLNPRPEVPTLALAKRPYPRAPVMGHHHHHHGRLATLLARAVAMDKQQLLRDEDF